jgi:lysophospholipid acyltransferase (LPLAT)-like uncharacterized protein
MKIRHPFLIKTLGFAIACLIRLWIATLRYRYRPLGPNMDPNRRGFSGRYIYAFWHENILIPAYHYGRPDIHVLISQHADGRLIAEVVRHLRFRVVAGSTTRGGIEAVRQMLRLTKTAHLAITPDGPRGPRRHVQAGVIYLAARAGLPIIPFGIAYASAWRIRSWDRLALPRPWSDAACVTAQPIHVPENVGKEDLEAYRLLVEEQLNAVTAEAERLVTRRVSVDSATSRPNDGGAGVSPVGKPATGSESSDTGATVWSPSAA